MLVKRAWKATMVVCDCFSSQEELTVHIPDVGFVNEVSLNKSFQSDGWFEHVFVGKALEIDFRYACHIHQIVQASPRLEREYWAMMRSSSRHSTGIDRSYGGHGRSEFLFDTTYCNSFSVYRSIDAWHLHICGVQQVNHT